MKLRNAIISLLLSFGFITGSWAAPSKIPSSRHVKYLFSAGDRRDYSAAVQRNHQQYATHRGVKYQFFDLEKKDSPVMLALGRKQKYWAKIVILQKAMENPKIPEGSWVAWADDDITFNDINYNKTMMDRVIEKYGKNKSVLVAKEENDWAFLNTGIMLVKKGKDGRAVLQELMQKSDNHKFGYQSQAEHSFHEQGALKELYLGRKGNYDTTPYGTPLKEYVGLIPQRDGDTNFNNFRRKSHRDEARNMYLVYNDSDEAKAKDSDAFIHHTGMSMTLRASMIHETLAGIDKQNEQILTHASGFSEPPAADKQHRQELASAFVFSKPPATEKQLRHEQARDRKERRAAAKTRMEMERQRKSAFVLPEPPPTEEQLMQEQARDRKEKRAAAKAKIKKMQEEKSKAREEEEKAKAEAEARKQAEAEAKAAAEQQLLYKTLLAAQLKENAETSLQGLQSLGSASSMMMMTTLSGLSSVMSSYRSGRAFSFGMASIDDIPASEMLASTAPTARSPVISRETGSWHNFVQVHMMKGNRNSVNGLPGGSISGQGLSTGVFCQLSPEMVAGMMFSVSKNAMGFDQGGSGKVSSISAGPFISYSLDNWHIDAALSVSRDNYEVRRKGIGSELKSEFSGTSLTGYLGTGYDIHLDHWTQGLTLTPMAELMLIHSRHGDYREQGSAQEALQVKSASNRQLIGRLGFEAGYLFPNLEKPTEIKTRFGVQHQKMSSQSTSYQLPTGTEEQIRIPAMSERSFFTGLGIQRQLGEHSRIALNYTGNHSARGNSHGFQLEFEKKL